MGTHDPQGAKGGSILSSLCGMRTSMIWGMVAQGVVALFMVLTTVEAVTAESEGTLPVTGAQVGTITAVHESSFEINGVSFQLAPTAQILDPKGNPLESEAIRVSVEVKYLVKREEPHKIVKMVLYLPR